MLVDIYARAMLNATRHSDLPQCPLSAPSPRGIKPASATGRPLTALFRFWRPPTSEKKNPSADLCAPNPNGCI